jgi:thiol-disulfide isomerase/thioredoxin
MKRSILLAIAIALALAALAGYGSYRWQRQHTNEGGDGADASAAFEDVSQNVMQGLHRPDFSLPDLNGTLHPASEWDGKVLVVNFWATWCPPCRKELPMFVELQQRYQSAGLQFVGIAIDSKEAVAEFVTKTPLNYPCLVSEDDGVEVARNFGNSIGALPFTAIVDRKGRILRTKPGEFSRAELERLLGSLLKS